MKTAYNLFIFRRDLRIVDNTALELLYNIYPDLPIIGIFIFNPLQIDPVKNTYYSSTAVEFMIESLGSLEIPMHFFHGDDVHVLDSILKTVLINAVAFNNDFTAFARSRDNKIATWCTEKNIELITAPDYTLFNFKIKNQKSQTYEVFTPYYKKCLANLKLIPKPLEARKYLFVHKKLLNTVKLAQFRPITKKTLIGGREHALAILKDITNGKFRNYDKERNFIALDQTTHLSPYLKFGCVSIREVFWTCIKTHGTSHGLPRELIWRDFFANLYAEKEKPMTKQWPVTDLDKLQRWQEGHTGIPLIDAAMICMNETGFMHNRLRMIVAMYLTHNLNISWKEGERYFAQKLIDYDPASNAGNWRAIANETYRIFNPEIQARKFDRDGEFVRRWLKKSSKKV